MELFSEIYSTYFRAVEDVLRQAQLRPLSGGEIRDVLSERTFSESAISMFPKLHNGEWPLLLKTDAGYVAAVDPLHQNPMTDLQKAWLKAILDDPRFLLFFEDEAVSEIRNQLQDIEPLYLQKDFHVFDKSSDGDDFASPEYQNLFRLILVSIQQNSSIYVQYEGRKGNRMSDVFQPFKLEYSQKDDKFRAFCYSRTDNRRMLYTLNISRIVSASPYDESTGLVVHANEPAPSQTKEVVIEITRERNALERCMIHFAHFEKRTEYDEATDKYTCTIQYNVTDETEVVIRVLSFGPTIRVLGPEAFVSEVRERVKKQAAILQRPAEV